MTDNQSDLVILGGGSGGYAAALRAAELGKSVVLIEKDKVGGTCLHRGCIPTKALLHAGEIADQARESATFGVNATFDGVEAYLEPRTAVTDTTIVLVARSGEWTRRRIDSPEAAAALARKQAIPLYEAAKVGYPQRMREWSAQRKAAGEAST